MILERLAHSPVLEPPQTGVDVTIHRHTCKGSITPTPKIPRRSAPRRVLGSRPILFSAEELGHEEIKTSKPHNLRRSDGQGTARERSEHVIFQTSKATWTNRPKINSSQELGLLP